MADIEKEYFHVREAFFSENNKTLKSLLSCGYDKMAANASGARGVFLEYMVIEAAKRSRYDVLEMAHELKLNLDPDPLSPNQYHNLVYACRMNDVQLIRWLIDHGVDCFRRYKENTTALHHAAFNDSLDAIDLLLANGMDLEAIDDEGTTPLTTAIKWGKASTVDHLLSLGANPNVMNKHAEYPLDQAIREMRFDRLELLLNAGATTTIAVKDFHSEEVRNIVEPYITNRILAKNTGSIALNAASRRKIAL